MQTGSELVQSGHYRSADIQRQMEEVSEAWEQLTEATTEKGRKLKDANELQVTCVLVLACACACACVCVSLCVMEGCLGECTHAVQRNVCPTCMLARQCFPQGGVRSYRTCVHTYVQFFFPTA